MATVISGMHAMVCTLFYGGGYMEYGNIGCTTLQVGRQGHYHKKSTTCLAREIEYM